MSRTWKDRPYRVMQAEATHAGCLRMRPYYHPFDDPLTLKPDIVAYAYAADHNTHIPARRFTLCRFVERSWTTDYGTRRQVREALHDAANQVTPVMICVTGTIPWHISVAAVGLTPRDNSPVGYSPNAISNWVFICTSKKHNYAA